MMSNFLMKANQITAIGVSVIALGVIIAGIIYVNKQNQRILNIYESCISSETNKGKLQLLKRSQDGFFAARKVIKECLSSYGINKPDEYFIREFEHE